MHYHTNFILTIIEYIDRIAVIENSLALIKSEEIGCLTCEAQEFSAKTKYLG